jgi:hypothetical protein
VIVMAGGLSTGRDNPAVQAMDLAVPGHVVQDALTTRPPFTFDNLTDFVLGLPGVFATPPISRSQVEWVEHLAPTTILVWLGSQDALNVIHTGTPAALTPVPQFRLPMPSDAGGHRRAHSWSQMHHGGSVLTSAGWLLRSDSPLSVIGRFWASGPAHS